MENHGRPLTEYVYQLPDKTGDGWETSSLNDAGIDSKKINALIRDIFDLRFANIHGILLVRNGKLVLEEYFNGYSFNFSGPDMYTAGHIPFQVGLEGVLSEGMDEIAHIEELSFEFVDFDRNKGLKGREWMP
jgi:hypothetical protein